MNNFSSWPAGVVIQLVWLGVYIIGYIGSIQARTLRQALYSRKGEEKVLEIIANWDGESNKAEFTKDIVPADDTLDALLDDPKEAFKKIFGPSLKNTKNYPATDWKNHIFCQKIVISQLCTWSGYNDGDFIKTLEDLKNV